MTMRANLTREVIVAAARESLEKGGIDNLSLRAVARDLGVTAPALYGYVRNRYDLLAAIATDHFAALVARFEAVEATTPVDRIRGLSRAYVDHALAAPALFPLLFRYPPRPVPGVDVFPPAARAFTVAASATGEAIAAGDLAALDPDLASMTMWAAVHGVAEILLLGFSTDQDDADRLIDSVIETVLAGQGAAPRKPAAQATKGPAKRATSRT